MRKPRASVRIGFGARGIYIIRKATLEQILFLKWHICLTTVWRFNDYLAKIRANTDFLVLVGSLGLTSVGLFSK